MRREAYEFDSALTIAVAVFIVAGFGLALGSFFIAIGVAVGAGMLLAAARMLTSRQASFSYLGGIAAGLLLTFLFYYALLLLFIVSD